MLTPEQIAEAMVALFGPTAFIFLGLFASALVCELIEVWGKGPRHD